MHFGRVTFFRAPGRGGQGCLRAVLPILCVAVEVMDVAIVRGIVRVHEVTWDSEQADTEHPIVAPGAKLKSIKSVYVCVRPPC
jgi:hypothetical protein